MVSSCEQAIELLGSMTDENFLRNYNNSSRAVSYRVLVV